jgi:hypothetical protein
MPNDVCQALLGRRLQLAQLRNLSPFHPAGPLVVCSVLRPAGTGAGKPANLARRCAWLHQAVCSVGFTARPKHRPKARLTFGLPCHTQLQPCRTWAGRNLPWWLPPLAARRLLERRRGSNASFLQRHRTSNGWVLGCRMRHRCVNAALHGNAALVVKSPTALPTFERLDLTGAAGNTQVQQALLSRIALHRSCGHWVPRTGHSCSACAGGHFRKGKICAPCDDNTKNVM